MLSEKANHDDLKDIIILSVHREGSEAQIPLLPKSSSRQRRSTGQLPRDVKGHSIVRRFCRIFANSEPFRSKTPSEWWCDYHQWERRRSQSQSSGLLTNQNNSSIKKSSESTSNVIVNSSPFVPSSPETSAKKQD